MKAMSDLLDEFGINPNSSNYFEDLKQRVSEYIIKTDTVFLIILTLLTFSTLMFLLYIIIRHYKEKKMNLDTTLTKTVFHEETRASNTFWGLLICTLVFLLILLILICVFINEYYKALYFPEKIILELLNK